MSNRVSIISGGCHTDERGKLSFFNDFNMSQVQRMYVIEPELGVVRAWQGHAIESKWLVVLEGEFLIQAVPLENSSQGESKFSIKLSQSDLKIVHIPGGYYNGFESLKDNSKLLVFSDTTTAQSMKDDFRQSIEELPWNSSPQEK